MMDNIELLEILQRAGRSSPGEHKINLGYTMPVLKESPCNKLRLPAIYEMEKGWTYTGPTETQ
ncbi:MULTISPECIES: hypothetical protein [unclassified Serratia (in: enterobacteria)]|uniref:hypothetical protein n=1 Tax=unclassified Serratia (in: enterobacteria) TaxID=2647522 RepID=UPI00046A5902|nr:MULTISPECIES: hypothetical protein [unclassified Serratia (in: enterobacteria)]